MLDADQELFNECLLKFEQDDTKEKAAQEKRELTWKRLEEVAATRAISNEAVLVSRIVSSLRIAAPSPLATASAVSPVTGN